MDQQWLNVINHTIVLHGSKSFIHNLNVKVTTVDHLGFLLDFVYFCTTHNLFVVYSLLSNFSAIRWLSPSSVTTFGCTLIDLCLYISTWLLAEWGFFYVLTPTAIKGTSVYLEDPWFLILHAELSAKEQSLPISMSLRLGVTSLSRTWTHNLLIMRTTPLSQCDPSIAHRVKLYM
jgi:hypothetical protein